MCDKTNNMNSMMNNNSLGNYYNNPNQGLSLGVQTRRTEDVLVGRYNSNTVIQTCFNQLPQVSCGTTADCYIWMAENCTDSDRANVAAVCDPAGRCNFDMVPN